MVQIPLDYIMSEDKGVNIALENCKLCVIYLYKCKWSLILFSEGSNKRCIHQVKATYYGPKAMLILL